MSNFFFSHDVFYSIRKLYPHLFNMYDIISLFAAELKKPKIGMVAKGLMTLKKEPFENNLGKGKNAGYQYFLLFPKYFLTFPKQISVT